MSTGSILPDAAWSISVLFGCLVAVGLLITEYRDLFSRSDLSRPARAGWVALSVLPLVGPLLYLLVEGRGLADRRSHLAIARLPVEDYLASSEPPGFPGAPGGLGLPGPPGAAGSSGSPGSSRSRSSRSARSSRSSRSEVPEAHRAMQEVTAQWLLETGAVTAAEYELLTAHDRALAS